MALAIAGTANFPIDMQKARSVVRLGYEFGLLNAVIDMTTKQLEKNLDAVIDMVNAIKTDTVLKDTLIKLMRKKWNGIFALIGKHLSKKP